MTTVTIETPTPVDVLNHKKRFAQALGARDAARTAFDKVKSAPRAAREGLMSLFRALHLDSLMGSAGSAIARWAAAGWDKMRWAFSYVGRLLGWRMLGTYVLTDTEHRNRVGHALGTGYLIASGAVGRVAGFLRRIPIVGGLLSSTLLTPLAWLDRAVYRSAGFAKRHLDAHSDHWLVKAVHKLSEFGLFGRLVRAFVPSRYRFVLYLAYWFKPAKSAYEAVREDEVADKIGTQIARVRDTAKAAAAEAGDVIYDRVMDGPNGDLKTTQPGVEVVDGIVVSTGQRIKIPVDIDSRGQKWVTWEGITYSINELPDEIGLLPVDLVTETARLDAARRAAAANGETPVEESRAVARALAAHGPRKQAATARPKPSGKGNRR